MGGSTEMSGRNRTSTLVFDFLRVAILPTALPASLKSVLLASERLLQIYLVPAI